MASNAVVFLALCIFAFLALSHSTPVQSPFGDWDEGVIDEHEMLVAPSPEHGLRQKRATCDLLSFLNLNHAACAAHCIGMNRGFRGGYCNGKAVCVCRR